MSKKKWRVNYNDALIEIVVRDSTGRREDKFVANQSDKNAISRIGGILKFKYGVDFSQPEKEGFFDY